MKAERKGAAVLVAMLLAAGPVDGADFSYRTVAGDTLIGIAARLMEDPRDWTLLQKRNRIANPRAIPVGTEILIPPDRMRSRPRPIVVEGVRGEASVGGTALAPGSRLEEGARVATGAEGFVTLKLADGSVISVPPATQVRIEKSRTYGDSVGQTLFDLVTGRVEATVAPQDAKDRFEVRSRRTVTGVRGTRFRVATLEGDAVATEVVEGRVGVQAQDVARDVEVGAGFGTRTDGSGAPGAPVPLLAAPGTGPVPTLVERTLVRLPFGAVEGARAYRAQVGLDEQLRTPVSEGRFATNEAKFADLPDGDYFVRLRAVDARGLEGLDAVAAFRLKARPEPPAVSGPRDRTKLSAPEAKLAWSRSTEAATYRVQVAATPDFRAPVVDEAAIPGAELDVAARVKPGTWHWRLAAVRADGDRGPWGDPRSFTVVPDPPTPKVGKGEGGRLAFEWDGEPGQRFDFQLARDTAFAGKLVERRLEAPRHAFELTQPGAYYFRVRAIDPDGFEGPWGAPQRVEVEEPSRAWMLLLLLLLVPLL